MKNYNWINNPIDYLPMAKVSGVLVPQKNKKHNGNVRWSKPVEPFANQRDYHGIKYEESQDREKTEETLGIVPLIACLFIWSAPLTSIDGWGIRLPLPTFEWTEASLLCISFFVWSRQLSFILNIVVRRTIKVIETLKACCFIWLVSPTSIVGRGIRLIPYIINIIQLYIMLYINIIG